MIEYTYHYCAEYTIALTQKTGTLDGITGVKREITSYEHYTELKDHLAEKFGVDRNTLVISSLSKLSEKHSTD